MADTDTDTSASQRLRRLQLLPLSELATANRQRDALYRLSEQLHLATTIDDIHAAAMEAIESALECDRSAILMFEAGVMTFVASHGLSLAYQLAVTGHSPWSRDEVDAEPIVIADVSAAELDQALKTRVLDEGIRAAAFVPLVSDEALVGKFMAYFREPRSFSREDVSTSVAIARQLSHAIRRHQTSVRLAEELNATRLLQSLSIEMANEADVEGLYARVVDVARIIMRSDLASLQQFIPHLGEHGELKLVVHHGFSEATARALAWVRAEAPCNSGTVQAHLQAEGIQATQSTPLRSRSGELVGMINTYWKSPHEPSEGDLRLLDIVARLATDLIERKTHDEEQRRREERLRTLTQLLIDVPWQARKDGAFAELQPAWENYTGQSWDAHAGHGWFDAIHPDDRGNVQATWSAACFYAQPYSQQARIWHARSGQYRLCSIRATPIRNEDGTVREWVGACTEAKN